MTETRKIYTIAEIEDLIEKAKMYDLEGIDIIAEFTLEEIQKNYNGIGPDRFPEIVRDIFTMVNGTPCPAVLIHDLDFAKGGSIDDFKAANLRLFHNLRKITMHAYSWWNPMRWIQWVRSWYFYKLCEMIGLDGWKIC